MWLRIKCWLINKWLVVVLIRITFKKLEVYILSVMILFCEYPNRDQFLSKLHRSDGWNKTQKSKQYFINYVMFDKTAKAHNKNTKKEFCSCPCPKQLDSARLDSVLTLLGDFFPWNRIIYHETSLGEFFLRNGIIYHEISLGNFFLRNRITYH